MPAFRTLDALRERPAVLAVALLLLALGAAGLLASRGALSGPVQGVDEAILLAFRATDNLADPIGPKVVEEAMRDVTALGGVTITTTLLLAVVAFLWLGGRRRTALFLLAGVASGIAVAFLLKAGFDRPRPDLVPHSAHVITSSFPSAHAATAAVLYLTLGAALARVLPQRGQRRLAIGLAIVVTAAVGVSRVYLGVHWPTDVLAGWAVGAGWAAGVWALERALQRQGRLEPAPPGVTD